MPDQAQLLNNLKEWEKLLDQVLQADRHELRRWARNIRRAAGEGKPFDRNLRRFEQRFQKSHQTWEARAAQVPSIQYSEELPISQHRAEIMQALEQHQVIVVCGETGSGKSTQLPKMCLEMGRGRAGVIGHTQPRRIAARSIAARLADELGSPLGRTVGYKIRFNDTTRPETNIKLMTDGVLLAETQSDRRLDQYDTIIVDEAHERSLNIDFLIGYLKNLLPQRRDLRIILTSATIDAERFAAHFPRSDGTPAPIMEVSGRTYPVEVRYRPAVTDDDPDAGGEPDLSRQVADAVAELQQERRGDTLVFLPTERDIRDVAKTLRGRFLQSKNVEVLPLYARLSAREQNRIFQPSSNGRRIVLATNVAESSLTVPGIHCVVDSGVARISRYSPRSKVQRLPIESVSKASANQRAGRCGRVGPGVCIRLYSEEDFLGRDDYTTPEIRRTNLANVILQMLALGLGSIDEFPFLDPPRPESIRDGYKTLYELGAIDEGRGLTDIGRRMSRLPVDPRIGRLILAAEDENCLQEILIIAAALEIQDPRDRPVDKQQQADQAHAEFAHEESDFMTYLAMWDFFHNLKSDLSRSRLRKACESKFLSWNRLREWQDVHRQLKEMVAEGKLRLGKRQDDYGAIHRALLTGLLSNVASLKNKYEYQGAGGTQFSIWPGSCCFSKRPKWVVAAELVETTRRYLRTVARVDPAWILPIAEHLVKRSYRDPHWSKKQQTVLAYEKITLFGLTIEAGRRTNYGPIDPEVSRNLFIESGLVEGELRSNARFYQQNRQLLEEIRGMGDRARSRAHLVSDAVQYAFYDERIPPEVYDAATLHKWLKRAKPPEVERLKMHQADLVPEEEGSVRQEAFPESLQIGPSEYPVQYQFSPGASDDGVTVRIPVGSVSQLDAGQLEWVVPGLLEEKIEALIRSLPKAIRRGLIPAPDVARETAATMAFGEGPFLPRLAKVLGERAGERIDPDQFQLDRLPPHLRINLQVEGEEGEVIATGRDVHELRASLGVESTGESQEVPHEEYHRDGIQTWDFGELPEYVEVKRGDFVTIGYPAVIDQQESVSLRLLDSAHRARQATRGGVRRLFCFAERRELKSQVNWLPELDRLQLFARTLPESPNLKEELTALLADRSLFPHRGIPLPEGKHLKLPRDEDGFAELCRAGRKQIPIATQDVAQLIKPLMEKYHQVAVTLESVKVPADVDEDLRDQLQNLVQPGFLTATPWYWLQQLPRYFEAMEIRVDKVKHGGYERDVQIRAEMGPYLERWNQARREASVENEHALEHYRWMLEEYRVSLFAQQLGTIEKVSPQRLDKQWSKVNG